MGTERKPEKLITVHEAAVILGLKECTVRLWLDRGVLRKIKLGKKAVRIPVVDVIKLVDESTVQRGGV